LQEVCRHDARSYPQSRLLVAWRHSFLHVEYFAGRELRDDEMVVIFALHRRHFERLASALYDMPT